MMKRIVIAFLVMMQLHVFSQNIDHVYLYVSMTGKKTLYDGTLLDTWAFGYYDPATHTKLGTAVPGPFLEFIVGDSVIVHFWNDSGESHSIHFHGLDVDQANDGVPSTSAAVLPFDSTTYHFSTPISGNYLYHCHVHTSIHLQRGMYGGIRVWEDNSNELFPSGPTFENHYNYLASDLYAYFSLNIFDDYFFLNGSQENQVAADTGNTLTCLTNQNTLLNFFNVGYSTVEFVLPSELNAIVYTSDGRPLPSSYSVDTLRIYSGERFGVLVNPTENYQGFIDVNYYNAFQDQFYFTNQIPVNVGTLEVIKQGFEPNIQLYPNPAGTKVHLRINEHLLGSEVVVYDVAGNCIRRILPVTTHTNVDISQLPAGYYIVTCGNTSVPLIKE